MDDILQHFPRLSDVQKEQFALMISIYSEWNNKINLISRKDMDNFYERHVLHSLSISKWIDFNGGAEVLDLGTGGGFPGIPLAIHHPETKFTLVDSIGKKVRAVSEIVSSLSLKNVITRHARVEDVGGQFDFITARAVARVDRVMRWTSGKLKKEDNHAISNGLILLKGGQVADELKDLDRSQYSIVSLHDMFDLPFFTEKYLIHITHS